MSAELIGWTLVHFLWEGAAIAGISALAMRAAPDARSRYAWACSGLAAMAAAPLVTAAWLSVGVAPTLPVVVDVTPSISVAWLTRIWGAGVALLSARLLVEYLQVSRLRRRSIAAPPGLQATFARLAREMGLASRVQLRLVADAVSPAAVGVLRPVVLLPASLLTGLSARQIEAILAHELAHVRRWDAAVNLLQVLLETALFYHPGVWWLSRRARQEREYCCDEAAVAACGDALTYARALTDLEALRPAPHLVPSAQGGNLMDRIKNIVGRPSAPERARWALPALLSALALGVVSAAVAGTPPEAENVWIDDANGVTIELDGDQPVLFLDGEEVPLELDGDGNFHFFSEDSDAEGQVRVLELSGELQLGGEGENALFIEAALEELDVGMDELEDSLHSLHSLSSDTPARAAIKVIRVEDGGEPHVVIDELDLENIDDVKAAVDVAVQEILGSLSTEHGDAVTEDVEVRIIERIDTSGE